MICGGQCSAIPVEALCIAFIGLVQPYVRFLKRAGTQ